MVSVRLYKTRTSRRFTVVPITVFIGMVYVTRVVVLFLVMMAAVVEMKPLAELFEKLMKKHTEIKNQQLMQFISKAVPYGIDPPNPKIAEYETFKSDKSANFVRDGNGNVVFRQFRRLRLADVLQRRGRSGI